jgi:hypothetical protein
MKFHVNFTNTVSMKSGQMQHLLQNGKNRVSSAYAACNVYTRVIQTLVKDAYAGCPKITLRKKNRLSALNAGARDVQVETENYLTDQ